MNERGNKRGNETGNEKGLTFDDILLLPGYSDFLPSKADTASALHPELKLNTPIISSAMDTVTEHKMAIAMAQLGGFGVIHKNMSIPSQAMEVEKVKKFESGVIQNPITAEPECTGKEALGLMKKNEISGLPVTKGKILEGLITHRDLQFETRLDEPIACLMTKKEKLITAPAGVDFKKARELLHIHRIEKLPLINDKGELEGLITIKDIKKALSFPLAAKDKEGRLFVSAAIGVYGLERAEALHEAGVDLFCVDSAHGHSKNVLDQIKNVKKAFPKKLLMAGNAATFDGAKALIEAGADIIKIGMGPGSICTTRIISGVGVPQVTALMNCAQIAKEKKVSLIADGGIQFSGDIVKALALGSGAVMIGSLLAGADESPGETHLYRGRAYKMYRGMGSLSAMKKGSKDRYAQEDVFRPDKLVPEGVEGRAPYSGPVQKTIEQLMGGLRAGMGYIGARNLAELKEKAQWMEVSDRALKESHVHDISVTKEAPNYRWDL